MAVRVCSSVDAAHVCGDCGRVADGASSRDRHTGAQSLLSCIRCQAQICPQCVNTAQGQNAELHLCAGCLSEPMSCDVCDDQITLYDTWTCLGGGCDVCITCIMHDTQCVFCHFQFDSASAAAPLPTIEELNPGVVNSSTMISTWEDLGVIATPVAGSPGNATVSDEGYPTRVYTQI